MGPLPFSHRSELGYILLWSIGPQHKQSRRPLFRRSAVALASRYIARLCLLGRCPGLVLWRGRNRSATEFVSQYTVRRCRLAFFVPIQWIRGVRRLLSRRGGRHCRLLPFQNLPGNGKVPRLFLSRGLGPGMESRYAGVGRPLPSGREQKGENPSFPIHSLFLLFLPLFPPWKAWLPSAALRLWPQ